MRCRIAVAALLLLPASAVAQADTTKTLVEGKVLDPVGTPLGQTEIVWQTDKRSVLSRADGSFSLSVPLRGPTVILVRRPGYNAQALRVDLSRGMWRGTIVLEPGSFKLPDVEVEAKNAKPADYAGTTKYDGFFQRRKLGLGTFITRQDIERLNAFHTMELMRLVPGARVSIGPSGAPNQMGLKIMRCAFKTTVWIDGALQQTSIGGPDGGAFASPGADVAEVLSRLTPTNIEFIEVYRGAAQIPGAFHWDGDCVIAIWTRYNPVVAKSNSGGGRP